VDFAKDMEPTVVAMSSIVRITCSGTIYVLISLFFD
jgi:hypothetical protein